MMDVGELINLLEEMPRNYQVRLYSQHCGCAQDIVSVTREDAVEPGNLDWGDAAGEEVRVVWVSDQP